MAFRSERERGQECPHGFEVMRTGMSALRQDLGRQNGLRSSYSRKGVLYPCGLKYNAIAAPIPTSRNPT
jgi:hypothetical protein